MAKYSPYRAAKVQQKEPGRPLLVIVLIVAVALGLFWWLQSDRLEGDVVGSQTGDQKEKTEAALDAAVEVPEEDSAPDREAELRAWWNDVEPVIADALRAGQTLLENPTDTYACDDLRYQVGALGDLEKRPEATLASPIASLERSLDRAASSCAEGSSAVTGSVTSAKQHLRTLVDNARAYGLQPSYVLEDFL